MSDEDILDGRMTPFDEARQRNREMPSSSSEGDSSDVDNQDGEGTVLC